METLRKPLQGMTNIVRFNWPFYAVAGVVIALGLIFLPFIDESWRFWMILALWLSAIPLLISLAVSAYVYDFSGLYAIDFIADKKGSGTWVNIHAGFDESSRILLEKFKPDSLLVFDFYNAEQHTEASIERARKAYGVFPGTQQISSTKIPMEAQYAELVLLFLSAHEVRDMHERVEFFKELKRIKKLDAKIYVVEHLRDLPNFLAYTLGFFHFHSLKTWLDTFKQAELSIDKQIKLNPFIRLFILS